MNTAPRLFYDAAEPDYNIPSPQSKEEQPKEVTPLDYFREGYKYYRNFNKNVVPYDEAAEITMKDGFDNFKSTIEQVEDKPTGEAVKEIETGKDKPFIVANVREVLDQYDREEISYMKMVELFNEIAFNYYNKIKPI